jgi:hypothetical protein
VGRAVKLHKRCTRVANGELGSPAWVLSFVAWGRRCAPSQRQGWARDLSESGLGAFVAEALIRGELVTLEIPMPSSEKQAIPAKVIRALGTEYGFQFTALSAEQRQQIRTTLQGRPAIPYRGAER